MKAEALYNLDRFKSAQDGIFDGVIAELRAGRKQTHWMWFIFPQLRGLGRSLTAQHFGITSIREAHAYLADPVLSERLELATSATVEVQRRSAFDIFGSPDDLKFHSSMTLFNQAAGQGNTIFRLALEKYFQGVADAKTLDLIRQG